MTSQQRLLVAEPISQEVLRAVYASDQDMYPAPLTLERLQSWVASCHDLSASWLDAELDSDKLIGVIIVLPVLRPHWEELLVGKIRETQLDTSMFPGAFDSVEVGLHIFHVERFGESVRGFTKLAMDQAMARVKYKEWQVVGLSALAVTPAGKKTFRGMGFEATGYTETFLERDGEMPVMYSYPGETPGGDITDANVRATTEMLVKRLRDSKKQK